MKVCRVCIVHLTLSTSCHGIPFFRIFTQVRTFYWLFGKIWSSWIRNKSNFWKKKNWWSYGGKKIGFWGSNMATWHDGTFDINMTSSEVVRTRHHMRRFLRRYLVLKIKPNTVQTLGTTNKIERRKNMAKSEGRALLTIETLKTFYCCIEKPICGMNPTHSVPKI